MSDPLCVDAAEWTVDQTHPGQINLSALRNPDPLVEYILFLTRKRKITNFHPQTLKVVDNYYNQDKKL